MNFLYHHRTQGKHVEAVHIRGVVDGLRDLGHEVTLVEFPGVRLSDGNAPANHAPGATNLLSSAAKRLPPVLFTFAEVAYNAFTFLRLGIQLAARRPDAIYERYSLFLAATTLLARLYRIPIVLEINDSALVERVRPLRLIRLATSLERWCFRNATGLVFISGKFLEMAQQRYGDIAPAVVSPNAVDSDTFDPSKYDRNELRRNMGLDGCIVAGYVGAFVHWHGVRDFVVALGERIRENDRLRLLLVGDGVDYAPIREFVEANGLADRILMPGRITHNQIPEAIACMDFSILPNSNEYGSPMKLFELMAMEVPVLAPDYDPIREVTRDGQTGWLFPRKRIDVAVERTLQIAAHDPEQIRSTGRAARRYVRAERRWVDNVEQFLPLYRSHAGS